MSSLVDILGSYVAVDNAGSDGGIVEVDGACEDGASAFGARGVPAPATPEGASGMHISGGAADGNYCTPSTPTRGSGPMSDGGVINVDDVSEVGGLAFGARGVPASETAGAIVIGMTTSARGGGAAATPGNAGDPTRNVGAESDICAVMAAGTAAWSWETDQDGTNPGAPGVTGGINDTAPAPVGSPTKDSTHIKYSYSAEALGAE